MSSTYVMKQLAYHRKAMLTAIWLRDPDRASLHARYVYRYLPDVYLPMTERTKAVDAAADITKKKPRVEKAGTA